jgi:hypothetical protein
MGDLVLEKHNTAESGTYLISDMEGHWNPLYTYDQPVFIVTKWDGRGDAMHISGESGGLRSVGNWGTGAQLLGGTYGVIGTGYDESGVVGTAMAPGKSGVFGYNTCASGKAYGVSGFTMCVGGIGVLGQATAGVGVQGESFASGQAGVYGSNEAKTGDCFGVIGQVRSNVGGELNITSSGSAGVLGISSDGTGVLGTSNNTGVWGYGRTVAGVMGMSGTGHGVVGGASVQTKYGVYGINVAGTAVGGASRAGVGVFGTSASNNGVLGLSWAPLDVFRISVDPVFAGVAGVAETGVGVLAASLKGGNAVGLYATAPTAAAIFKGDVVVDGNLFVRPGYNLVLQTPGNKNAVVTFADGSHRLVCAIESPEAWFEDFGEAALVKGKVHVALDPAFARTVDVRRFHVFITPYGETAGLYVSRRTKRGFDVAERKPGKSSVRFSWRVVARPKSTKHKRFTKTTIPEFAKTSGNRRQKTKMAMPNTDGIDMQVRSVSKVLKHTKPNLPEPPELPKVPKRGELGAEMRRLMKKTRKAKGVRA